MVRVSVRVRIRVRDRVGLGLELGLGFTLSNTSETAHVPHCPESCCRHGDRPSG